MSQDRAAITNAGHQRTSAAPPAAGHPTGETLYAAPRPRGVATRESIAHAFLAEYHRLLAEALTDVPPATGIDDLPVNRPAGLRQRAFAWRVTAARIPLVPEHRWPVWLLDHLQAAATTPIAGVEYARQRELLVRLLGAAGPGGLPPA